MFKTLFPSKRDFLGFATCFILLSPGMGNAQWAQEWWNGRGASGEWLGLRPTLEEHGLKLSGEWKGTFYGFAGGGRPGMRSGFFDEELKFGAEVDFAKFTKIEALEGLKAFSEVRWRDGLNPNTRAGAFGTFQPSDYQSGKQWRLLNVGVAYTTPELFGIKKFVSVTGGWLQPQRFFIDQPLSKLYINNAVKSSKGLGGNIPFSSSFSSWGGVVTVKPVDWYYARAGFFMAYPQATSTANHGLAFEGYGPDPSQNGFYFLGETGVTPTIGATKLPGKYAFGAYSYGQRNTSFGGTPMANRYGFYWQADQMLYRESSPEPAPSDAKATVRADGKKSVVPSEPAKLSEQGLSVFGLVTYAPKINNILPFYFHTGVVYRGLIPTRDSDLTMFSFAYGSYSYDNIENLQNSGESSQPNFSCVVEFGHRVQINKWSFVQPYLQYIMQPNGTSNIANSTVLGFQAGVTF
ncbi:MAG: carbohydrate porin [Terrimicrobiaceae bacterium]